MELHMYDRFVGMATAVWLLLLWPLLLWPLGFLAELDTWFIDLVVGLVLGFLLLELNSFPPTLPPPPLPPAALPNCRR